MRKLLITVKCHSLMSDHSPVSDNREGGHCAPILHTEVAEKRYDSMATYQMALPEQFDFNKPHEEWPKWFRRFERFRQASGLVAKDELNQVNTLIYSMGDRADDIFRSFGLSETNQKKYK